MTSKVYIMSNKAMPGLVKIGWTSKNDVEQRRKDLSNTSVPYPFVVEATYDVGVKNADKVIHEWFPRELRVNDNREFFNITVDYAKKVIEDARNKGRVFFGLEDDEDETEVVEPKTKNTKKVSTIGKHIVTLAEMGIPSGSTIVCTETNESCTLVDADKCKITVSGSSPMSLPQYCELRGITIEGPGKKFVRNIFTYNGLTINEHKRRYLSSKTV